MLKGLKMNYVDVKNALMKMDEDALSPDELSAIKSNIPTAEEVRHGTQRCLPRTYRLIA